MQVIGITYETPVILPVLARAVRAGFPSPADDFAEEEVDMRSPRNTTRLEEMPVMRA